MDKKGSFFYLLADGVKGLKGKGLKFGKSITAGQMKPLIEPREGHLGRHPISLSIAFVFALALPLGSAFFQSLFFLIRFSLVYLIFWIMSVG